MYYIDIPCGLTYVCKITNHLASRSHYSKIEELMLAYGFRGVHESE
jgi:hypothetical protein